MTNAKIEVLQNCAAAVRKEFDEGNVNWEMLKELYLKYNKVDDIELFIARAKEIFPKLSCGIASVYLQSKIGGKVVNGKYGKNKHTFLMVDGLVVDITADQYNGQRVYVGEMREPWSNQPS